MRKFELILLSLFVLIIGVGLVSAADADGTIDDDYSHEIEYRCGVDEISNSKPEIIEIDAAGNFDNSTENAVDDIGNTGSGANSTGTDANSTQKTSKLPESDKSINDEAKKYSEIFNKKNGKTFTDIPDRQYCYIDLILEVYRNHSNIEETVLISAYALQNSGYNITVAEVNDTFNQIAQKTFKPQQNEELGLYYHLLYSILNRAHGFGPGNALYKNFDNLIEVNV